MPDLHVNGRNIINQNQLQCTESAAIQSLRRPQKSLHKQTNKKVHCSWLRPLTLPPPQMPLFCVVWLKVPGGYSIYPWVGRCGPAPHTLTLFKTKIADFPTLFKTEFRFLIPCLRHLTRNHTLCKTIINIETLSYLIHWQSQNYLQLDQQSHAGCLSSKKRYPV